jgi:hypothetical protein
MNNNYPSHRDGDLEIRGMAPDPVQVEANERAATKQRIEEETVLGLHGLTPTAEIRPNPAERSRFDPASPSYDPELRKKLAEAATRYEE